MKALKKVGKCINPKASEYLVFIYEYEMEKGQLLEIHLLEKTARHQNLDCSTLFKQMTKIYQSARKSKKYAVHVLSSICIF
jgi:hypothetical protein